MVTFIDLTNKTSQYNMFRLGNTPVYSKIEVDKSPSHHSIRKIPNLAQ